MVLERKYRPRKLDQIVGQSTVVRVLTNAIKNSSLHHAYLLQGQYGSGKTTLARVMAASENCETSPGLYPCGTCRICTQIFAGTHTDVKEIDAASTAGSVDEARELKKEALYNPVDGARIKYFILDECLPASSLVEIDNGKRVSIGEIVEGAIQGDSAPERVIGRDMASGEKASRKILRYIKIPNNKRMYQIKIKDPKGGMCILKITGNHDIFVSDGSKVKAQDIKIGQKVFLEK